MQFKGYTLNIFQVEAAKAIDAGQNVLLSAPTGAGKTLVAEFAIDRAVRAGRRAIYTAPIKALSNQKYRDFKEDGLDVGLMTGDLTLNPGAPVVIMTTEIFRNSVFEDPERFNDVDFVVLDEVHFLDDVERGTVWEESFIFAPDHVRFIALSATIENLEQFGGWIDEVRPQDLKIIQHTKRPVPLDHHCFHREYGLFKLAQRKRVIQAIRRLRDQEKGGHRGRRGDDQGSRFDKKTRSPGGRISGRKTAGRGDRGGGDRRFGRDRGGFNDRGPRAGALVLDHCQNLSLMPVLFFCFSRKECEIKAEKNLHRRLLNKQERETITKRFDEICETFELNLETDLALQGIRMRALRGVGYHHAGMLPIHKEVVERLFTSTLLKMLFTTETFALGINMPARTVVFDSLRKFDGVSFDYMRARDYMQMAGRAGRQGIDDEGLVISILDDEALTEAPLPKLFGAKVEPVTSRFNLGYATIMNLYERMGSRLTEAYDRSFAAFQIEVGSRKKRQNLRNRARARMHTKIQILKEAGYLDTEDDGSPLLLPRGLIARQINGYEVQVTELLLSGVLDECDRHQLVALFTAVVHEARRGQERNQHGLPAKLVVKADQAIRRFITLELTHGVKEPIKEPDFSLSIPVMAWSGGCSIDELADLAGSDGGDVVRTLRMAIQMMRQLRIALSGDYGLIDRLQEAIVGVNRDEVDAKRQFELG
ncbi:MAG: DEAD/DEAH box helicase [Planctomycetota bacterium]